MSYVLLSKIMILLFFILEGTKPRESPSNEKEKSDKEEMKPQNLTCCILMLDILLKQVGRNIYLFYIFI